MQAYTNLRHWHEPKSIDISEQDVGTGQRDQPAQASFRDGHESKSQVGQEPTWPHQAMLKEQDEHMLKMKYYILSGTRKSGLIDDTQKIDARLSHYTHIAHKIFFFLHTFFTRNGPTTWVSIITQPTNDMSEQPSNDASKQWDQCEQRAIVVVCSSAIMIFIILY